MRRPPLRRGRRLAVPLRSSIWLRDSDRSVMIRARKTSRDRRVGQRERVEPGAVGCGSVPRTYGGLATPRSGLRRVRYLAARHPSYVLLSASHLTKLLNPYDLYVLAHVWQWPRVPAGPERPPTAPIPRHSQYLWGTEHHDAIAPSTLSALAAAITVAARRAAATTAVPVPAMTRRPPTSSRRPVPAQLSPSPTPAPIRTGYRLAVLDLRERNAGDLHRSDPTAVAFSAAGTYTVTLTVTDNEGATDDFSREVTVVGAPPGTRRPVAGFTVDLHLARSAPSPTRSTDADGTSRPTRGTSATVSAVDTEAKPSHTYAVDRADQSPSVSQ